MVFLFETFTNSDCLLNHQNPCVSRIYQHLISFACLHSFERSKLFVSDFVSNTMIESFDKSYWNRGPVKKPILSPRWTVDGELYVNVAFIIIFDLFEFFDSRGPVKFVAQHFEDPRPCLIVACSLVQAELFLVVHHTSTSTHLFAFEYIAHVKHLILYWGRHRRRLMSSKIGISQRLYHKSVTSTHIWVFVSDNCINSFSLYSVHANSSSTQYNYKILRCNTITQNMERNFFKPVRKNERSLLSGNIFKFIVRNQNLLEAFILINLWCLEESKIIPLSLF